jgi:hypothetical protein
VLFDANDVENALANGCMCRKLMNKIARKQWVEQWCPSKMMEHPRWVFMAGNLWKYV